MNNKKVNITPLLLYSLSIILLISYFLFDNTSLHYAKVNENNIKIVSQTDEDPIIEEVEKLYQQNHDLVGYLIIEGTNISYPVMYTQGEDYYLYRDFYKQDYRKGSLFIDKHNTIIPRDTNIIIHGHSMKDGSMFADLLNYKDKNYYLNHPIITFYTITEKEEYQIIGVIISPVYSPLDDVFKYYNFYNSTTVEEYDTYLANIQKLSLYSIEDQIDYRSNLLTLSTCEYSAPNSRIAVIAKRIN